MPRNRNQTCNRNPRAPRPSIAHLAAGIGPIKRPDVSPPRQCCALLITQAANFYFTHSHLANMGSSQGTLNPLRFLSNPPEHHYNIVQRDTQFGSYYAERQITFAGGKIIAVLAEDTFGKNWYFLSTVNYQRGFACGIFYRPLNTNYIRETIYFPYPRIHYTYMVINLHYLS